MLPQEMPQSGTFWPDWGMLQLGDFLAPWGHGKSITSTKNGKRESNYVAAMEFYSLSPI